jgi:hypothetical protein
MQAQNHHGIIIGVNRSAGTIDTVEGNKFAGQIICRTTALSIWDYGACDVDASEEAQIAAREKSGAT